jgi:signal transduction histidine kinase
LNDVLEKISLASSEMVAEMNDTVWAINPGNDNMEKIIQRMESFARPLVAARNIHFSFQYDKEMDSIQLDMEKRKNFYLIFKEAVNNAIKYSGASALKVELTQSNNHFELLVKDDGVGFNVEQEMKEPSPSLSGNWLRNMQMRAKEMKGELQLNSLPGEGTEIRLNFPIP